MANKRRLWGYLKTFLKSNNNVDALVGLVTTAAHVDVDKAEIYEKKLKPLSGLKGININDLEKTSGAKPSESSRVVNIDGIDENKKKDKNKKKRKRKPRYPKGFAPANPGPSPDPERWLPKRERSSFRPKRKDKRAANVRGSQGAVSRDKQENGAGAAPSRADSSDAKAGNSKSGQASTSKASQNSGGSKSKKKSGR